MYAAKHFGYHFIRRSADSIFVDIFGKSHTFQLVAVLAYSQMRKMMSVILRDARVRMLPVCGGIGCGWLWPSTARDRRRM